MTQSNESANASGLVVCGYLNDLGEFLPVEKYEALPADQRGRTESNPLGHYVPVFKEQAVKAEVSTSPVVLKNGKAVDLDTLNWSRIKKAAAKSAWVPKHVLSSHWVDAVCQYLEAGLDNEERQEEAYQKALTETLPPMSFASTLRWFFMKGWSACSASQPKL